MLTYKTTVSGILYRKNFASLELAEAYFEGVFGVGISVKLADPNEQIPDPTPEQRLQKNLDFGQTLKKTFLQDNVDIIIARGYNFTESETSAMDAKFQYFFRLAEYGSIPQIAGLLPSIEVDALFTQARKDKYTQMINDFFAS
jgi:hypothetical protein